MSADNWEICPRCVDRARAETDQHNADLYAKYGKVPADEWEIIRDGMKTLKTEDYRTFRENYELVVGASDADGGFVRVDDADPSQSIGVHIIYRGRCTVCNLEHKHRSWEAFYDREDTSP